MLRTLLLVAFVVVGPAAAPYQSPSVLHIKVTVLDAERRPVPVARHALLISDSPVTTAPQRAVTSLDGTTDVNLRPGRYIVESDRPVAVDGRAYEWSVPVDVAAGRDTTLELTTGNARVGPVTSEATIAAPTVESGPSALLTKYEHSVLGLWTPHAYASGFLVDANGLVATSHRAIGDATAVEVQVSPTVKVAATVLSTDTARDVAILWIDPAAVTGVRPVPVACPPASSANATDERLLTIDVPPRRPRGVTSVLSSATAGGPVFTTDGTLVGLTSSFDDSDTRGRDETRVVGVEAVCEVLASAATRMSSVARPDATHLPVESGSPLPLTAVAAATAGRAFTLNPYRITSSDFDIVFITPLLLTGAEAQRDRTVGSGDDGGLRAVTEFWNWSDYVREVPPVLLIRVTPRLVEGLWMKIARGAAMTQGAAQLPPIKRLRPGFSSMRVLCGGRTITPVHPFKIQGRLSETEAIDEGLYVFDPAAIGPQCGTVTLALSSVKDPSRTETRVVDPAVIRRIAQDFASLPSPR